MELLVAALGATALWAYYKHLKSQRETSDPPPGSGPPTNEQLTWDTVATSNLYIQVLARVSFVFTAWKTIYEQRVVAIPAGLDIAWEMAPPGDAPEVVQTRVQATTNALMMETLYLKEGLRGTMRVVKIDSYRVTTQEVVEAVTSGVKTLFNGIVVFDTPYIDLIVRLAIK